MPSRDAVFRPVAISYHRFRAGANEEPGSGGNMKTRSLLFATTALAALAFPPQAWAQSRDGGSYGGNNSDNTGGYEQDGIDAPTCTPRGAGGGGAGTATTRGDGGAGSTSVCSNGSFGNGAGGVGGVNGITAATLSGVSTVGGPGGTGLPASTGTNRSGGGGGAGG